MKLSIHLFSQILLIFLTVSNLIAQPTEDVIEPQGDAISLTPGSKGSTPNTISSVNGADVDALRARLEETEKLLRKSQADFESLNSSLQNFKDQTSTVNVEAKHIQKNLSNIWLITCTGLVFLMQAGFMLLELGFARSKNAINIVMKNYLDFIVAAIAFYLVGYGLLYGDSLGGLVGSSLFMPAANSADPSFWSSFIYQLVFCGAAATIVSGAIAERTKFVGYAFLTFVTTSIIYPVYGHWAWHDQGWLNRLGFHDFAGGSVVHLVGGSCALAGVMMVGPRVGRFGPDGKARMIVGHNLPMAALGVFILWLGWLGFNAGSAILGTNDVGLIVTNTILASSAGALISMVSMWILQGRSDVAILMNGALGGLVAITAAADVITPLGSLIIGAAAGLITTYSSIFLEKLRLDDAVGAIPVHLANGIWGLLCVAIFNVNGFSTDLLAVQALGAGVCTIFALTVSLLAFALLQLFVGIRASETEQVEGLDFHEHSATAYPEFLTRDQQFE